MFKSLQEFGFATVGEKNESLPELPKIELPDFKSIQFDDIELPPKFQHTGQGKFSDASGNSIDRDIEMFRRKAELFRLQADTFAREAELFSCQIEAYAGKIKAEADRIRKKNEE